MLTTPAQIQAWLDQQLHRFDQPAQYLGTEPGAARKDWDSAQVRTLIAASWPYFHAAGNMSIPAVYAAINKSPRGNYLADRAYLPETPRDLRNFERGGVPVFGCESKHPAADFDIVATSISYIVLLMNFHKQLTMSGITVRRTEREKHPERYPFILIGGQAYANPEPLAAIADCIWCGEVEDEPGNTGGISDVLLVISAQKRDGMWYTDRAECYRQLAMQFKHLYFPRFVEVEYAYTDRPQCGPEPSKQVVGHRSLLPLMELPVTKRFIHDVNAIAPLTELPLLYSDPGFGAGDLEAQRGCPAWCSFCRLSWVTKPFRQRSVPYMVRYAEEFVRNMGSVELSPFGPDFPFGTNKKQLIAALLGINQRVDASTMRVDDFIADKDFILLQGLGGMDTVTIGVEGNSQRMRDLVGKGTSDAEIEEAVTRGIRAGIRRFKLYMITNFPGEEVGDVMRIVKLAERLAAIRDQLGQPGVRIQFSWTPLLIEANTPFQWFAPTPADHTLIEVAEQFRHLSIDFKIGTKGDPNKLALFQLCQRASRDVGEAVLDVFDDLGTASWGGVARDMRERLDAALRARGFANGFGDCFDERDRDKGDLFGWEFISTGVSQDLLWSTYVQMREFAEETEAETYDAAFDDRYHGQEWVAKCGERCMGNACGVCGPDDLRKRADYISEAEREDTVDISRVRPIDQSTVALRLRLRLHKPPAVRYVTAKHWQYAVRRAAYRAAHATGAPPIAAKSVTLASDVIPYKDWSWGADYAEFGVTRRMTQAQAATFVDAMRAELAPWVSVTDWGMYPADSSLRGDMGWSLYDLALDATPAEVQDAIHAYAARRHLTTVKIRTDPTAYFGGAPEEVPATEVIGDVWATRYGTSVALRFHARGKVAPYAAAAAILGKPSWIPLAVHPVARLGTFEDGDPAAGDLLRPYCEGCGLVIPTGLLGEPYDAQRCARCGDEGSGLVLTGLLRHQAV